MAKPKKSASRGATKQHGPKRKMFHGYNKCIRASMAKYGLLSKYTCRESFALACQTRGIKSVDDKMWFEFSTLKTRAEKDAWLKQLSK